jgi:divalent metal cation (Fe/Co/Zn/Cd) transporter
VHSRVGNEEACCGDCAAAPVLPRQVAWLQWITLAWMALECGGSLWAAAQAHSVALLAFGSDSLVEMLSASVVLLQFLPRFPLKKIHADRAAAILLFLLAGVVVCIAVLARRVPVETSCLGIWITALALIVMPVLAWLKRRQALAMNNRALAADATQSATCAYLAGVTLAGLAINALWHIPWVDTVAALAAVPILIVEGRRAWRGEGCGCSS